MKNPFKKNDHTVLIAGIAIASVAVGALAYLYLSESGNKTRKSLKKKVKEIAKNAAAEVIQKKAIFSKKTSKVLAEDVVE
ncbi:YtxH domain-containing protein [Mucilaginibacter psychrotolerans]|uniref:YtxH domain-containing protein n=1 Tax=Mucilaginibacter psychrotolerans TaxID=1524096 RepID=A0A4Y8RX32_9SPHI|nr:YtxH domain-containing protein [Mucilaginibacter psychrotolerans]TFF29729.1 YtxH domain-containing protein [Mucilaginibacter psychrotolerans]